MSMRNVVLGTLYGRSREPSPVELQQVQPRSYSKKRPRNPLDPDGDGIIPPDRSKGYTQPFNYRLWNKLREQGRVSKNAR